MKNSTQRPAVVTFDFPIWIKAVEIVLTMKLPIILRLGGFHTLKSFLGSIGNVMEGSGIEEMFKLVYPKIADTTVGHIMSGGAYYKAVRCHLLVDAALIVHIMKDTVRNDELELMKQFILLSKTEKLGLESTNHIVTKFEALIETKLESLKKSGRTATLWVTYHYMVTKMKVFIRAERTHDWQLHLACLAEMLYTFAATGHSNYAKGSRLKLELVLMYALKYKDVVNTFVHRGLHTVRYSTNEWSGIWSDMAIEQKFMKVCKTSGGLTGGRFRNKDSAHKMYCGILNHSSKINEVMGDKLKPPNLNTLKHKDTRLSNMKKDADAITRILMWLKDNDPFYQDRHADMLISLSTGLNSKDGVINPEKVEEVGQSIQQSLDNGSFLSKFPSKMRVKPLSHLTKTLKIKDKEVVIQSLKLFNRLIIISERELTVKDSLAYELTPLPMSLFLDTQYMRKTNKALLGNHIKKSVQKIDTRAQDIIINTTIVDGGWLLHQIHWNTGRTYGEIAKSYIGYLRSVSSSNLVVVFDGYRSSTKDHEHQRRRKNICNDIEVTPDKELLISKTKFLDNTSNKTLFINILVTFLRESDIEVRQSVEDADTLIVKTALEFSKNGVVNVITDDTDVLIVLVHHIATADNTVYLTASGSSHDIESVYEKLTDKQKQCLLLTHSFSGCDTVSSIFGFGKVKFFNKICRNNIPETILDVLTSPNSSVQDVKDAGVKLFEFLYTSTSKVKRKLTLTELRYHKFTQMTAKGVIRPEKLPPTKGAAEQHALRAYLQISDWMLLTPTSLDPTAFGWTKTDSGYKPIGSLNPIAPDELQKFICCGCEGDCKNNKCSCVKNLLKCVSACSECHGMSCLNTNDSNESDDE